ncbi:MAG: hypothetical protein ACFFG0_27285 [Candidatus Thorarchaeota archaeon]
METSFFRKLSAPEIMEFISYSKDVVLLNNVLVMQPKTSSLTLDFSSTSAKSCIITFRRDAGNGIFFFSSGGKIKNYQVTSKTGQGVSCSIDNGKIVVNRNQRSRGTISILDISLYKMKKTKKEWKVEISKCLGHACLRFVGDELHASEGAWIKGPGILVETSPAGMFKEEGNVVKFIGSCIVVDLKVDGKAKPKEQPIQPLHSAQSIIPILTTEITERSGGGSIKTVYDSSVSSFIQHYCNNQACAMASGVEIDNKGSYIIPIDSLDAGQRYRITVWVSKIDGNGKMAFGFLPDQSSTNIKIVSNQNKSYSIDFVPNNNGPFSLGVWRPNSSKGKIKLTRISLETTGEKTEIQISNYVNAGGLSEQSLGFKNTVESKSKFFSIFVKPKPVKDFIKLPGKVNASGFYANLWLNRVQILFPGIENSKSGVVICDVDNIIGGNCVWIKEFKGNFKNRLDALKNTKVIFTPSLTNKIQLAEWFPQASIKILELPLPKTTNGNTNGDFCVYLEDSKQYTQQLFNTNKYKLHIVGTRCKIPENCKYISEYSSFEVVSKSLSSCAGLLSFNDNNHYKSGIIELALNSGIPVITNNNYYINKAKVIGQINANNLVLPQKKPVPNNDHNKIVIDTLKQLGVI